MATIVNTPGTPVVERSDSSAGWAVAVIILLLLIVAAFFVWGRYRGTAAPAAGSTNINVTLPAPTGGTGGTPPSGAGAVAPQ